MKFLPFLILFSLFTACATTSSSSTTSDKSAIRSDANQASPLEKGQDFLNQVARVQYVKVSGIGPEARVRTILTNGSLANLTPQFIVDGELMQTSFRNVYNAVISGNDLVSVRRLSARSEIVRYGLPSGAFAIEVVLAKGK